MRITKYQNGCLRYCHRRQCASRHKKYRFDTAPSESAPEIQRDDFDKRNQGAALIATKPEIETIETERAAVVVRALEAHPTTVQMLVRSQGTVAPRTESELIPEVSGRVEWVAPSLVTGGFFEQGDVLLRIDPVDYTAAVERARAQRARAQGEYEYAASRLARQVRLSHESVASASQYDDAQRAARVTQATLEEAKVALAQAQRDLERTEVRAPFAGRVRDMRVRQAEHVYDMQTALEADGSDHGGCKPRLGGEVL